MPSPRTIELVKATVPALQAHGLALTTHFYDRLFTHEPELKNIFNLGNQAGGQQQQALALAVLAYAQNLENPSALAPVASRIAHKHASIGIRPDHYPIVGRHLLASIREVLGEAATDEIIAAWGEAYGELADVRPRPQEGELPPSDAQLELAAQDEVHVVIVGALLDQDGPLLAEGDFGVLRDLGGQFLGVPQEDHPAQGARQRVPPFRALIFFDCDLHDVRD